MFYDTRYKGVGEHDTPAPEKRKEVYTMNNRFYTVFSQFLAGYLMQKGFVLMAISENEKRIGKHVFHFVNSAELQKAIDDYKMKR